MTQTQVSGRTQATPWDRRAVSRDEALAFAQRVPSLTPEETSLVAQTMGDFPSDCQVRGLFFEGLGRVVGKSRGREGIDTLFALAGVPMRFTVFSNYPHRDFYKLYLVAAKQLFPTLALPQGLERTAQTFWPIFRDTMLGKTFFAMMSEDPMVVLSVHARAHAVVVQPNEHSVERTGEREARYLCRAERSPWYPSILRGIVAGGLEPFRLEGYRFEELSSVPDGPGYQRHEFRVRW